MFKKTNAARILQILEQNAGAKLSLRELLRMLEGPAKKKKAKSIRRSRPFYEEADDDPYPILTYLEELGMVELHGEKIHVSKPFSLNARMSFSPKGLAFAAPRNGKRSTRDVFIIPQETAGSLPGDEVIVRLRDKRKDRFEGVVTRIVKRARVEFRMKVLSAAKRNFVPGLILDTPGNVGACMSVESLPADMKHRIKPDTIVNVSLSGRVVNFLGSPLKEASFIRFEDDTDMDKDYHRVLIKYNYNPVYPPQIALPEEMEPDERNVSDWKERHDLRHLYTITIDGADSKDFDDAISLTPASNGKWKLYVHIADVEHYVKPGTALDEEAKARATSVYLSNRVVPMLPPRLSENLCSLVANKNRLAFTAEMDVNDAGEILHYKFYKSIIRVDRRYTYDIAESELNTLLQGLQPEKATGLKRLRELFRKRKDLSHSETLLKMWHVALAQKKLREKAGRLDLNIPEVKFGMNHDEVETIHYRERLKSGMLIEEFMLSANICTAEFLRKKGAAVLYRVHEPMEELKRQSLNQFFLMYDIPFQMKDSAHRTVQKALDTVSRKGKTVEKIFNIMLLRSFMQANYRAEPLGHWGLAFKDYCHFTSPIRRYPDLVVHRVLHAVLKNRKKPVYTKQDIDALGIHTSEQERRAMDAERDITKIKTIRYIRSKGMTRFTGYLSGFRTDRVFIELDNLPVEGIVKREHLTNDAELILPDKFSVYVKKMSRPAFLGERWELDLESADPEEMCLLLKPDWKSIKPNIGRFQD